uniref:Methionyl-tRNA synthetase family protein n=1 Tax=Rhizophora mucronata TaxID=61149 RepID=A0A2P2M8T4_RHIMU
MLIAILSPCFILTFSMASIYCSTSLPTSPDNFIVRGCESAYAASGTMEPYPAPGGLARKVKTRLTKLPKLLSNSLFSFACKLAHVNSVSDASGRLVSK